MIANDFNSFAVHCNAIKNVVALRGGYDNLGFDGFIKINALTYSRLDRKPPYTANQILGSSVFKMPEFK
jgi:hypothetical protein